MLALAQLGDTTSRLTRHAIDLRPGWTVSYAIYGGRLPSLNLRPQLVTSKRLQDMIRVGGGRRLRPHWPTDQRGLSMAQKALPVPIERIEWAILLIRGQKVILDADLAALYEVETRRLNEQVKRNKGRFPEDFMFQLTKEEWKALRSQFAISKPGRGGRRHFPYAFTEHGALMAASVLNSPRAVEVSVYVVRAFVRLREMLASHKELGRKLRRLEKKLASHDDEIMALVKAIRQLATSKLPPKQRRIGFVQEQDKK